MMRVQIVGGGRMGEALLGGLLESGWAPAGEVAVVETRAERRAELEKRFPGVVVVAEPAPCDGAVLAVKPPDVPDVGRTVVAAGARRILSIAAGVSLATLEAAVGDVPVVRAMPNTPALVRSGAAAIAGGSSATEDDLAWAEGLLGAVGTVVRVSEPQLDAVTGLSGSGPAYVFLVAEALVEAGVLVGLARPIAEALAYETIHGAAVMLRETGEEPAVLRAAVTSPGGTTAAGLRALEEAGVRAAFLDAVSRSCERARELDQ